MQLDKAFRRRLQHIRTYLRTDPRWW